MSGILLLADDLIFISRVRGHAQALGLMLESSRTPDALLAKARERLPACVLLDLHIDGLNPSELVASLRSLDPRPFIVGYGSHVDVATLKKAREAGCDLVLPRSAFVDALATDLATWAGTHDKEPPTK